jgi:hypothetical protein
MAKSETTLVIMLGIALIAGLFIGHMSGYEQGITYQKEHLVNLSLEYYEGSDLVTSHYVTLTPDSILNIARYSTMTEYHNITNYRITLVPENRK